MRIVCKRYLNPSLPGLILEELELASEPEADSDRFFRCRSIQVARVVLDVQSCFGHCLVNGFGLKGHRVIRFRWLIKRVRSVDGRIPKRQLGLVWVGRRGSWRAA